MPRTRDSQSSRIENMRLLVDGTVNIALNTVSGDNVSINESMAKAGALTNRNNGTRVNGTIVTTGFLVFDTTPGFGG